MLGGLYAKINTVLSENGYAVADAQLPPVSPKAPAPHADRETRNQNAAREAAAAAAARAEAAGGAQGKDPLSELRVMLHAWREGLLRGQGDKGGGNSAAQAPGGGYGGYSGSAPRSARPRCATRSGPP